MGQSGINSFRDCLAQSHAASDLPFWEECYRKAFPNFAAMVDHRQFGDHQRAGIDRTVVLFNSKRISIDEKVRFRNRQTGRVYEDIALEEFSVFERGVPGWVVKPLLADYIAYAIAPLGRCYLFPVEQLQLAWRENGAAWKARFQKVAARNETYTTVSWAVPVDVLFRAIGNCHRVTFPKYEEQPAEAAA